MVEQHSLDILQLIVNASGVVLGVLALLIALSVISWYVIGYKSMYLSRAQAESARFLETFWQSKRMDAIYKTSEDLRRSPVAQVFRAGYIELTKLKSGDRGAAASGDEMLGDLESIERALRRAQTSETTHLESMVPFLATTGSAAPFIGLFGTVWGIMNSFRNIGAKGAANLTTVAPGIAEALIATAIGLVAAIPAVMAYNHLTNRVKGFASDMDDFSMEFLNISERNFT